MGPLEFHGLWIPLVMIPENLMRVLITAGPTYEPLDAVRFLGNRSSGKLGSALADRAAQIGWRVTLLLGPNAKSPTHPDIEIIRFGSTNELQSLLSQHFVDSDCLIMSAAVADFRPAPDEIDLNEKRSRSQGRMQITLEPTPDLLHELSESANDHQLLIGFALEPADRLLESAQRKLHTKNIDLIVANALETMDSDTVHATLIGNPDRGLQTHESTNGALPKKEFAAWLLEHITPIAHARAGIAEQTTNG